MADSRGEVTRLLGRLRSGDAGASDQLMPLIYDELRRIAGVQMRRERPGHTLQSTAVVHEAYLRLMGEQDLDWQNRAHFFAIAAKTMRRVLLDYARQRRAGKRGGERAQKVDLEAALLIADDKLDDVVAMDELLGRLQEMDPQQARIVELRFFAGLNVEETAEVMGISETTVKREWRSAKAWIHGNVAGAG
jgi:RNA polymerase sigma factor (TIGR02999 family)